MAELTNTKWEGKASGKVKGVTAEQIWPLLEDFCNFHKLLTSIDTCYEVEGAYGQPGLIRHCTSTKGDGDEALTMWCREKLLTIDPIKRCLSYEIIDNNVGFKSYVGTWKLIQKDGDDQFGCEIEWSFVADPIDGNGMTCEDFLSYIEVSLQGVVDRLEKAMQSTN